jgi:TRAP-type C4-dicarboxylate transport system permease small subunit
MSLDGWITTTAPFPRDAREKLPPPRRDWGLFLWPVCALAVAGLLAVMGWLWPTLLFLTAFWPVGLALLVIYLVIPAAILFYAAYESERRKR